MRELYKCVLLALILIGAGLASRSNGVEGNLPLELINGLERFLLGALVLSVILYGRVFIKRKNSN
jgi:hypothetical protein